MKRRVDRRQSCPVKAATGERIVTFGRAGKPPENPFCGRFGPATAALGPAKTSDISQRFLKPHGVSLMVRGTSDMALGTKKRETRKSLYQSGWITMEGGFAARQCVVRDISTTGAKVTIDDPNTLPAKLRLAFSRDARTGRNCEVVWRRGKSVGIKFVR
jgi:hypothetical protein